MSTRCIGFAAIAALLAPPLLAQPSQLYNSKASGPAAKIGGHWIIAQQEKAQDLNGDGDKNDRVLVEYDATTHAITSLGLAVGQVNSGFVGSAAELVFAIDELSQGSVDLNGDGDQLDQVLAVYHYATHSTTVIGEAQTHPYLRMAPDGSVAVVYRSESKLNVDLDGDGDKLDMVVGAIDPSTGAMLNTGRAIAFANSALGDSMQTTPCVGGKISLGVYEAAQSADFTGDGDLFDIEFTVFDLATATAQDSGLAIRDLDVDAATADMFLQVVEFEQHQTDLNGDGDASDRVLFRRDGASGTISNLGQAGAWIGGPGSGTISAATGRAAAFVFELQQGGVDLNGDGDAKDAELFRCDLASGALTDLHASFAGPTYFIASGDVVAVNQKESALPADLNGDGDKLDTLIYAVDLVTGALHATHLESFEAFENAAGHVGAVVTEQTFGATTLNFDADRNDRAVVLFDVARDEIRVLPASATIWGGSLIFDGTSSLAYWIAVELDNGKDLNGNGGLGDNVPVIHDLATNTTFDTGLAASMVTYGDEAVLQVSESSQNVDLDGDGLKNDVITFFYEPRPMGCGAIANFGAGCPTSAGSVPALDVNGCMIPGGEMSFQVRGGIAGKLAMIGIGAQAANLPLAGNCTLLASAPFALLFGPLPLAQNGKFLGTWELEATIPQGTPPGSVTMQAFVADPGKPLGFAASQGVAVTLVP